MSALSTSHAVVATLPALALLSGCAATSPNALAKYQPPPAGQPAAVIDAGKHGRAWSVDGAETPSFAGTLRLVPGEHRVGINCLSYETLAVDVLMTGARAPLATPVVNAKTTLQFVLVTGSFEAGKTYFTRCVAVNGQPRAWLADALDGSGLPQGFTSVCTRECPPSSHHDASRDGVESVNQPAEAFKSYSPSSMVEVRKLDDLPNGLRDSLMRGKYGASGEGPEGRCCVFLVGGVSQTSAIVEYEFFGLVPTYQATAFVQGTAGWVEAGAWNIGYRRPTPTLVELKDLTSRSPDIR
jgi:hypothetical protein